jgi:hypothetical protein
MRGAPFVYSRRKSRLRDSRYRVASPDFRIGHSPQLSLSTLYEHFMLSLQDLCTLAYLM